MQPNHWNVKSDWKADRRLGSRNSNFWNSKKIQFSGWNFWVVESLYPTKGHLNGKKFAEVGPDSKRDRVNLVQVKPLTVKIEDSGLEMVRPMRINRMSSVRQARLLTLETFPKTWIFKNLVKVESMLRLANSWRWDDLNEIQQMLYEAGNRGWRYFSDVVPIQFRDQKIVTIWLSTLKIPYQKIPSRLLVFILTLFDYIKFQKSDQSFDPEISLTKQKL